MIEIEGRLGKSGRPRFEAGEFSRGYRDSILRSFGALKPRIVSSPTLITGTARKLLAINRPVGAAANLHLLKSWTRDHTPESSCEATLRC
jgi:hypothetical protein